MAFRSGRGIGVLIMAANTMALHTLAAYGMYPDDVPVQHIVHTLNQSGFDNEQICLMVWPRHHIASVMRDANILNSGRSRSAMSAEMIGWLMKLGAVIIPTAGFFIRSRAFLRALVMRKDSPGLCGNAGALLGLGFSKGDAERLEDRVCDMGVLIYVTCPEKERTATAMEVLRQTGARETAMLEAEAWA
jgi:hypothetical protein